MFNQPLSFDTSNVNNMQYMFLNARAFNQPLSFDTSSVTTMQSMFSGASAFNQPLSFDTSSVTDMSYMFTSASAFNQPLRFETSSVTTMDRMFSSANSLSAANKLLIRCAWAGTPAFASAGYGSSWGPGICPPQASCGQTLTGSTSSSSNRIGNLAPDHIYEFCTSVSGTHTFNSCGSSFDTWLRVWTQDLSHELLSCDDCGSCGTQTILTGELGVGCYKLVIDGYSTSSGTYTVGITCS